MEGLPFSLPICASIPRRPGSIAATGTVPATLLFAGGNCNGGPLTIKDCDLSALSGTLVATGGTQANCEIYFNNCKLNPGATVCATLADGNSFRVEVNNSDDGNTNYRYSYDTYWGKIAHETTIVRTGGATDGTTALSWNMTSSARAKYIYPLFSREIAQWQNTSGTSKTASIYLTTDATLNDNDFWAELEYPTDSSTPLGATVSSKMAWFGTPAELTSDGSTWAGTAKAKKYRIDLAFTPRQKGPVKVRLFMAKASTTVYVDPLLVIV